MRTTRLIAIALLATVTAAAGCKKDKKEGEGAATDPAGKSAAKGGGIPDLDAAAFYKDFNTLDGMAALDKYGDGVIVSGKVLRTIEEASGSTVVWLDSGEGTWVSLGFKDSGAAVKAKAIKEGDTVKAQCEVGGSDGAKYVMNIDCELK